MTRSDKQGLGRSTGTGDTPVRLRKADVSRERVLAAAAKIFAERGYAGTTMRAVADRVGLQAASLYYHYRSKEDLIEAVLATALNAVSEAVRLAVASLPQDASARERINCAILAHLTNVLLYGDYALASRRVLGQVPAHVRRRHIALRDAYSDFWLELLEAAAGNGELHCASDLHLTRTFILGALNSVLEWYNPQVKSIEELAAQFSLLISEGVFAPVEAKRRRG